MDRKYDQEKIERFIRRFSSDAIAQELLEKIKWNGVPTCPKCQGRHTYPLIGELRYQCNSCRRSFSVRSGTILENSKLKASKWVIAIMMYGEMEKRLTIKILQHLFSGIFDGIFDDKKLSNNTAAKIKKRIKEGMEKGDPLVLGVIEEFRSGDRLSSQT